MGFAKHNEDDYEIMRERIEAMERRKKATRINENTASCQKKSLNVYPVNNIFGGEHI